MIRFNDDGVTAIQFCLDERSETSEIHQGCDSNTVSSCDEAEIVDRVMGYAEWFEIDITDAKLFARFYRDSTLLQRIAALGCFAINVQSARPRPVVSLL